VTHNPSRKEFFAKLTGLAAAFTLLPRLFTKNSGTATPVAQPRVERTSFAVRADDRAVARCDTRG
jgi:hypothetical protein